MNKGGKFPKKLWWWGVIQDNLVLSTEYELIMSIGHRKEVRKLTFRALALRHSEDEGLTLEMSAF